jgi:hypothetical protein
LVKVKRENSGNEDHYKLKPLLKFLGAALDSRTRERGREQKVEGAVEIYYNIGRTDIFPDFKVHRLCPLILR